MFGEVSGDISNASSWQTQALELFLTTGELPSTEPT